MTTASTGFRRAKITSSCLPENIYCEIRICRAFIGASGFRNSFRGFDAPKGARALGSGTMAVTSASSRPDFGVPNGRYEPLEHTPSVRTTVPNPKSNFLVIPRRDNPRRRNSKTSSQSTPFLDGAVACSGRTGSLRFCPPCRFRDLVCIVVGQPGYTP